MKGGRGSLSVITSKWHLNFINPVRLGGSAVVPQLHKGRGWLVKSLQECE